MATLGMSAADREAVEAFRRDVVEPSMTSLVILDFWAEWCGPCKALSPVLEKVAADYAGKGVILAKVNVDEQKLIASQVRVQSIPTVYALFQGQLVADLTQARSESQLKQMLDQRRREIHAEVKGKMRGVREEGTWGGKLNEVLDAVESAEADIQGDLEFALVQMKSETLNKVTDALARLEQGDYGNCFDCGEEIAEKRLRALPFAVRCKDCEEARETAERRERQLTARRGTSSLFVDV